MSKPMTRIERALLRDQERKEREKAAYELERFELGGRVAPVLMESTEEMNRQEALYDLVVKSCCGDTKNYTLVAYLADSVNEKFFTYNRDLHAEMYADVPYAEPLEGCNVGELVKVCKKVINGMMYYSTDPEYPWRGVGGCRIEVNKGVVSYIPLAKNERPTFLVERVPDKVAAQVQVWSASVDIKHKRLGDARVKAEATSGEQAVYAHANNFSDHKGMAQEVFPKIDLKQAAQPGTFSQVLFDAAPSMWDVESNDWAWVSTAKSRAGKKLPVVGVSKDFLLTYLEVPKNSSRAYYDPTDTEPLKPVRTMWSNCPHVKVNRTTLVGVFKNCVWYQSSSVKYQAIVAKFLESVPIASLTGPYPVTLPNWCTRPDFVWHSCVQTTLGLPSLNNRIYTHDPGVLMTQGDGWLWNPTPYDIKNNVKAQGIIVGIMRPSDLAAWTVPFFDNAPDARYQMAMSLGSSCFLWMWRVDKDAPTVLKRETVADTTVRMASACYWMALRNYELALRGLPQNIGLVLTNVLHAVPATCLSGWKYVPNIASTTVKQDELLRNAAVAELAWDDVIMTDEPEIIEIFNPLGKRAKLD